MITLAGAPGSRFPARRGFSTLAAGNRACARWLSGFCGNFSWAGRFRPLQPVFDGLAPFRPRVALSPRRYRLGSGLRQSPGVALATQLFDRSLQVEQFNLENQRRIRRNHAAGPL